MLLRNTISLFLPQVGILSITFEADVGKGTANTPPPSDSEWPRSPGSEWLRGNKSITLKIAAFPRSLQPNVLWC